MVNHLSNVLPSPLASKRINTESPFRRLSLAFLLRWLHIYVSMLGFAVILFFSVTGITLNHPALFGVGDETTREYAGTLEQRVLLGASIQNAVTSHNSGSGIDRLGVVESLRNAHAVRGAVADFREDEEECAVSFRGPGYSADAIIDITTGKYDLTITQSGLVAVINDLHKGRDTGRAWSIVIDVSAALMAFSAITGLLLLLYLKKRRTAGFIVASVGALLTMAIYALFAP